MTIKLNNYCFISELVSALYGLTPEEIEIVVGRQENG